MIGVSISLTIVIIYSEQQLLKIEILGIIHNNGKLSSQKSAEF